MYNNKILFLIMIVFLMFASSCVTKKNVLYLQDIKNVDISKIFLNQNFLQVNDILKIEITSLEMKASLPYNKNLLSGSSGVNLGLMQLNGYLVSNNKTINFPILGEISVEEKNALDLENYLKNRLESENHLIKPNVTVRLLNSKVTILGEVTNPGTFNFTEKNISLLQAL